MYQQILTNILENAIDSLICEEANYILSDVSERSVCARLALRMEKLARGCEALEQEFGHNEYFADVENNRKGMSQIKRIPDQGGKNIPVTCDLILHSRGASATHDNLIAIEMTKANKPEHMKDSDRWRLQTLTQPSNDVSLQNGENRHAHVYGYKLGALLELNWRKRSIHVEYFTSGIRLITTKTIPIRPGSPKRS